jgi:cytochrome c
MDRFLIAALATLAALPAPAAHAQDDTKQGVDLFAAHCAECHSVKEGRHKKGPSLFGVVGARAAQREGYAYSDALKASQITWNADVLSRYLAEPRAVVPGGKMKYDGLPSAAERSAVIGYLGAQH